MTKTFRIAQGAEQSGPGPRNRCYRAQALFCAYWQRSASLIAQRIDRLEVRGLARKYTLANGRNRVLFMPDRKKGIGGM
jgi:hypothetical protein